MLISNVAIRRPVFTAMVVIALMTLGALAARNIGVDLYPNVDFPFVIITTPYPGAGPEEVEQLVSKQVEEATSSLNGIDEVRSFSRDSVSTVFLQFKLETDIKNAATEVREKMASIRSKLPNDIKDPIITRYDPSASAVLTYAVSSKRGPAETRRLTEDVIKPKIESVDGVGAVTISGGLEREIHVFVNRARLDELNLSIAQISQQLSSESFDLPGGRITEGETELSVRTLGRFRSLDELKNAVVASLADGSQVHLGDVARIEDGYKEIRTKPFSDGEEAVTFEIQKQSGTNTVAIADAVYKRLDELKEILPKDVTIKNLVDTSTFIRRNYSDVRESIVWGGLMAILVIFVFMLDWRSTFISSLALPTSVITTFIAMSWMGFSFNMMSMLGLQLAIGLLIDDAVVVRENIYRHMEMGEDPITAAQRGTSQIGLAVMATTFTVVAVFVPVAFTGGIVGKFFRQFGLTVAAAVLVSLFISFTLDPMMSARVVKPIKPGHHEELRKHFAFGPVVRGLEWLDQYYKRMLAWALSHRKTVIIGATASFVGSLMLMPLIGVEFVPRTDNGEFVLKVEAPTGTSFAQMEKIAAQTEKTVRTNKYVRNIFTIVGPGEEANKANLRVYLTRKTERPGASIDNVQDNIRQMFKNSPYKIQFADPNSMDDRLPVYIQVRGENYETLQVLARQVLDVVKSTPGTKDADVTYRPGKPETNIQVDRAAAADLGVSLGTVAQTVRLALEGEVVAKYRQGERDWDVLLRLSPEDRSSNSVLREINVPITGRRLNGQTNNGARLARIGELGSVDRTTGPATIERFGRQRQILVQANVSDRSLGEVVGDLTKRLEKIERPAGYTFEFGGQAKNMKESFTNMLLALAVAILFIYFVLASQFESFIHPLTIMTALPLAMVGALVTLFVTGNSISIFAMIGVILLMGLVTKNSILLVDLTNELRAKGHTITQALLEAGPTRLRPILMTSAAMVLASLPAALSRAEGSEMRVPMNLAVIGGVITSTILTLVVVPVVYTWMDRFTFKGRSKASVDVAKEKLEKEKENDSFNTQLPVSAASTALRREV